MKIFKQKQYTLQEGHYTGPKDLESGTPGALKVIGGATLAGLGVGAIADSVMDDPRKPVLGGDQPSSWATRGAAAGFVTGVLGKILLNTMHNPMDTIRFNELDRAIRRNFGMYRAAGVTIGDSRENRDRMKESFVINSKELTSFKVNISITKGKFTMYTLGLSKEQEEELNDTLDYYCKKYYGMKYTSSPIGKTPGSWSITITFTNHQVAANFVVEVGEALGVRINLLDADITEDIEKTFSQVPFLDKTELKGIFSRGILKVMTNRVPFKSMALIEMVIEGMKKVKPTEISSLGLSVGRDSYGNKFLEGRVQEIFPKNLWTAGENNSDCNIYLFEGTLIVCATKGSKEEGLLKRVQGLTGISGNEAGASLWTYTMKSPRDLDILLKKILSLKIKVNIYIP